MNYGINLSMSENPNHYLMLAGLFYLIVAGIAWIIIPGIRDYSNFIFYEMIFVLIFGLILMIKGYIDLKKKYDGSYNMKVNLTEIERDIKKEELRLIKLKKK